MHLNKFGLLLGCVALGCAADPVTATQMSTTGADATTSSEQGSSGAPVVDDGPDTTPATTGPVGDICGNDLIDGEDVCDGTDLAGNTCMSMGFDAGELGCTGNCGGFDLTDCGFFVCGDGSEDGDEDCDGTVGNATCANQGFDNGTLFCTASCEYDFSQCGVCGDGTIDGGEDCDIKGDLPASCGTLGFMTGTLLCGDDCLFDSSLCSSCGNDLTEGTEDCDGLDIPGETCAGAGFESGTLACQDNCQYDFTACGVCGNNIADGDELCDGLSFGEESCVTQGFDSGELTCNATCDTITTENCGTCGNATIDGSEVCDGDLFDGQTCASLGLEGGDLACSATCAYDFAGCDLQGIPFGTDTGYTGLSLDSAILPCDDISLTGTNLNLSDDSVAVAALGFTFNFYGTPFTDVTVQANGTLNFSAPNPNLVNECMPTATHNHLIATFWDDLNPGAGGAVVHQTLGAPGNQRFVVQWDVPFFGGDVADMIRVQAVLHEAGNIDVCYPDTLSLADARNSGAQATAGIQLDSLGGIEFSCNTPDLLDGLWLMYIPL